MKLSWKIYLILLLIFIGSILVNVFIPMIELVRQLSVIPGVFALFLALYQLFRDEANYQKKLLLQQNQQLFDIGATSHMANVVFDNHILFCEAYIAEMHETLKTLHTYGIANPKATDHALKLNNIRREHTIWQTTEMEKRLEPFEAVLRQIGANASINKDYPEEAARLKLPSMAMDKLFKIIGKPDKNDEEEKLAAIEIFKELKEILGIEELTTLRQKLLHLRPNPSINQRV